MNFTKTVVTLSDGTLALEIKVTGKRYTLLKSDIIPKTMADIKTFTFMTLGETQVYEKKDYEPLAGQ